MKILKRPKVWGLIIGVVIGGLVWQGLIINQFASDNTIELWLVFGVTYMLIAGFYLKFDIHSL